MPQEDKKFEELFLPFVESLFSFSYHLTRQEEDAQDLVQETLLKAFKSINTFQREANPKAWLFSILKNSYINAYRKKKRQAVEVAFEEKKEKSDITDLRKEIFDPLFDDEVTRAIYQLSDTYRLILLLSDLEGFSYEEIAEILKLPMGTVRSRLFRA
ncbi:MAG: sigma-70 family RNA polymerase sigma factor, partial [Bacteroidetes bacterium]|nr:sigma-70 family RNA polymerase sigma factor [Bacteroidota bacterium]